MEWVTPARTRVPGCCCAHCGSSRPRLRCLRITAITAVVTSECLKSCSARLAQILWAVVRRIMMAQFPC